MDGRVLSLTPAQRRLLFAARPRFGQVQRARGTDLQADGAVRDAVWLVPDKIIEATVLGGHQYRTRLAFMDSAVETDCSCPFGQFCKHAFALVRELEGLPGPSAGPGSPGVASPPPQTDFGPLLGYLQRKSGKALSRKAETFLAAAQGWWATGTGEVPLDAFLAALGQRVYWGGHLRRVVLFPLELPPVDAEEFLACLVLAAAEQQVALPQPLSAMADRAVVQRLEAQRAELARVREWRQSLSKWARGPADVADLPAVRLRLQPDGVEVEIGDRGNGGFVKASRAAMDRLARALRAGGTARVPLGTALALRCVIDAHGSLRGIAVRPHDRGLLESLSGLLEAEDLWTRHVVASHGGPVRIASEPLRWDLLEPVQDAGGDYRLSLVDAAGASPGPPLAILPGRPHRYVTHEAVYALCHWPQGAHELKLPAVIPARAFESHEGLTAIRRLGLAVPARLATRLRVVRPSVVVEAQVHSPWVNSPDLLRVSARAVLPPPVSRTVHWTGMEWREERRPPGETAAAGDELIDVDQSAQAAVEAWFASFPFKRSVDEGRTFWFVQRISGKSWAAEFAAWLARRPPGCEVRLDRELAGFESGTVAGRLRLDVDESAEGIDWFDLRVDLDLGGADFTPAEIALLLKARGGWVKLPRVGWRRLEFAVTDEERAELAEAGLDMDEFGGASQRLHALQLGALAGKPGGLIAERGLDRVRRRIEDIKTRVAPELPAAITADLRPYQVAGYHFLAYLTGNNFGGVLADDMGLGKTLQAIVWLAHLRETGKLDGTVLVVCPKSVQDNWRAEADKFCPGLRVDVWSRASAGRTGLDGAADVLVIHYAQLRLHASSLHARPWAAVILDEAQAIKNPSSQNARAACALRSPHRLALTGTPIENRLADLWSIFAFAMPGLLGTRAAFARNFEKRQDALARRRLAARTRPFLLRRTKKEVARDLPDRVEEDLVVEMDGAQAALYRAELKHARAQMLRVSTPRELDKVRFNILTSLLRLRQICCHPQLVGLRGGGGGGPEDAADGGSAKVGALLEVLEPLMDEGQKVLVFSQFVQMLDILEAGIGARQWTSFRLTGQTEGRAEVVDSFQRHKGAAVFLISLKAGGTGLNLTAASYVVLFDPWWNPAVEAQAIDRTHRIGQQRTVFAYRILVKGSIEEKIRQLQLRKGALAQDILGEENFAAALTLDDFRFLLSGGDEDAAS